MSIVNKIPGFRTRTPWKMALAGFVYSVVIIFIAIATINPTSPQPEGPSTRETSQPAVDKTQQQATNEALESEYKTQIVAHAASVGQTLTKLGELLQTPQIEQDKWTFAVAAQIVTLQNLTKEAATFIAPPKYEEAHGYYLMGMDEFAEVTKQLPKAIDSLDMTLIETAALHMEQGGEYVKKAIELLQN